jgi:uncharacterized membrane protein YjfL (UPF0719 family)
MPVLNWGWTAIAVLLVVYVPIYILFKKNKVKIQNFMEEQAALDVETEA